MLKLLMTAELIEPIEKLIYTTKLSSMLPENELLANANKGVGLTAHEFTTEEAIETAEHCQNFVNNLPNRINDILECLRQEELPEEFIDANALKRNFTAPTASRSGTARLSTAGSSRDILTSPLGSNRGQRPPGIFRQGSQIGKDVELQDTENEFDNESETCWGSSDNNINSFSSFTFYGSCSKDSDVDADDIVVQEVHKDLSREKYRKIIDSNVVSESAKAKATASLLLETLASYGLYCRHFALILQTFKRGKNKKTTYFGTYRTELIVDLFPNIIDIHNFELIWRELAPFEVAAIYCRIGRLNLFNPMKPEGGGVLNLSWIEDRHVAKMILMLSAVEPGDNIKDAGFRLYYDTPNIPGWEINSLWMTEDGVQKKGFFTYNYYTGEGKNLAGCRADLRWRTAMLHSVLVSEFDILKDMNKKLKKAALAERKQATDEFMFSTKEKWTSYLRFKPEKEIHAFELST